MIYQHRSAVRHLNEHLEGDTGALIDLTAQAFAGG